MAETSHNVRFKEKMSERKKERKLLKARIKCCHGNKILNLTLIDFAGRQASACGPLVLGNNV